MVSNDPSVAEDLINMPGLDSKDRAYLSEHLTESPRGRRLIARVVERSDAFTAEMAKLMELSKVLQRLTEEYHRFAGLTTPVAEAHETFTAVLLGYSI